VIADERDVQGWTRLHAAALLLAGAASLAFRTPLPAALVGAASLVALSLQHRGRWTRSGALGAANAVTACRLVMVTVLGGFGLVAPPPWAAVLVIVIFALDGLDGWLARRSGDEALFGAVFDQECDALMLLVCSLLLYSSGRLGAFVLIAGCLRYFYVLAIAIVPEGRGEAPRSRIGRWGFGILTTSMALSLWPLEPWHRPITAIATLLITCSFGHSLVWSLRRARDVARLETPNA
jgi:phosphatidylglycerophosphate synthase